MNGRALTSECRTVPVASLETRLFWDAAARGELCLPKCTICSRLNYPPPPRCPICLSDALVWVAVSNQARVRSWTVAHLPTVQGVTPPFTIVEGALVEQPDLTIVALANEDLAQAISLDQPVIIAFDAQPDGSALPQFRPSDHADAAAVAA